MTYVICEGGIAGLYRYSFTIFEKKIKKKKKSPWKFIEKYNLFK